MHMYGFRTASGRICAVKQKFTTRLPITSVVKIQKRLGLSRGKQGRPQRPRAEEGAMLRLLLPAPFPRTRPPARGRPEAERASERAS